MHVRALTKYLSLVLHPSFKTHYWQRAEWPEEWVDAAVKMVEKILLPLLVKCHFSKDNIVKM